MKEMVVFSIVGLVGVTFWSIYLHNMITKLLLRILFLERRLEALCTRHD